MTVKQRKEQFGEKRSAKNPDYARKAECDESKLEMAKRMLCHAAGHGINFKYVLTDNIQKAVKADCEKAHKIYNSISSALTAIIYFRESFR